jgi:phosphoglycolate phosphatase-like HAD superfamily hydrolase
MEVDELAVVKPYSGPRFRKSHQSLLAQIHVTGPLHLIKVTSRGAAPNSPDPCIYPCTSSKPAAPTFARSHAIAAAQVPVLVKTLVLWDIDGTLILSGNAGQRALVTALHRAFGIVGTLEDVEVAGRTDPWIARRVLAKFSLPDTPDNVARYLESYLTALPGELANPHAHVLPGVRELLSALAARGDVAQGLLTGNLRRGAEIKLSHHDLWAHFAFGAFADDAELRNELGPHALRRAATHHSVEFAADRVWILGDTPHDIECGKAIGARTLAVATGGFTVDELRAHKPTAVVANLADTDAIVALLVE